MELAYLGYNHGYTDGADPLVKRQYLAHVRHQPRCDKQGSETQMHTDFIISGEERIRSLPIQANVCSILGCR